MNDNREHERLNNDVLPDNLKTIKIGKLFRKKVKYPTFDASYGGISLVTPSKPKFKIGDLVRIHDEEENLKFKAEVRHLKYNGDIVIVGLKFKTSKSLRSYNKIIEGLIISL